MIRAVFDTNLLVGYPITHRPPIAAWRNYNTRAGFAAVPIPFEDSDLSPLFADQRRR